MAAFVRHCIQLFALFLLPFLGAVHFGLAAPQQESQSKPAAPPLSSMIWPEADEAFSGNQEKLQKIQTLVKERLAANPKDAEAMVWQGTLDLIGSGAAYNAGDLDKAGMLWGQSLKEMDDTVALEPANISVRMVRGIILLPVTRIAEIPEPPDALLAKVRDDFTTIAAIPKPAFQEIPPSMRALILGGLGESHDRLGNAPEARKAYQRVVAECPDTPQHKAAAEWLAKNSQTQ